MDNIINTCKGIVAFDFDGVIAEYNGWKGLDIFGSPIKETIKAIQQLYKEEYYIIIFTTRLDTPKFRSWLKKHKVPYNDINKYSNQPPHTSDKPVWHVYVGDRAIKWTKDLATPTARVSLIELIKTTVKEAKGE